MGVKGNSNLYIFFINEIKKKSAYEREENNTLLSSVHNVHYVVGL